MSFDDPRPQSSMPPAEPPERDRWKYRRRAVAGTTTFFCLLVAGLALFGHSGNVIHEGLADNGLWAIVALVGIYLGAPVAEDWLKSRKPNVV